MVVTYPLLNGESERRPSLAESAADLLSARFWTAVTQRERSYRFERPTTARERFDPIARV